MNASSPHTRPLRESDLERIVAIDQAHTGRSRRSFLGKRLKSALERPEAFIHAGIERNGELAGFALARLLRGEFGRAELSAALDLIGVAPDSREHGYGRALLEGLLSAARRSGVKRVQSQAEWTELSLLGFFDATGFRLAKRVVLERSVSAPFDDDSVEV
ncbi:MAG: GNAT family N-acetyltransferase [Gammaproteobacteria bacterium]|nr:GNAT family N-acetyltransferase [Gammaproteobacteria bacterium]